MSITGAVVGGIMIGLGAVICTHVERQRLQRRLHEVRRQNLELQAMIRRQGDLAREVAHELKNPITAVVCAAEALELLMDAELDDTNRRTLRHIRDYGDYILRLMHDFIDVSRGAVGHLSSSKEVIDVSGIIHSVAGLLAPAAGRKGISLEVEEDGLSPFALVDPKHLKQMIFNLLENAIKFSWERSVVVIRISESPTTNTLMVKVCDSGRGMSKNHIERLFDPLFTAACEGTRGEIGTGLGLALTKSLADLEGIRMDVQSAEGQGTTVTLHLELADRPIIVENSSVILIDDRPLEGHTVLLVDADPRVRDTISRLIEALGGAVDGVSLAVDAVHALNNKEYSTVMIDESADGLQGCELAQLLKEEPSAQHVRIVVASSQPVDKALAKESGADRCIEKPLSKRTILESLLPTH